MSKMDYWFVIEPYVFFSVVDGKALLYNTLDGEIVETDKPDVISLLKEVLQEENLGVVLLQNERYIKREIHKFVETLREKFMGDIINVCLSNDKPIQLLPYYEYFKGGDFYRKHLLSEDKNILDYLLEVNICVDDQLKADELIFFLLSCSNVKKYNLIGDIETVLENEILLTFLIESSSEKTIQFEYKSFVGWKKCLDKHFIYRIDVHFPIDIEQWTLLVKYMQKQFVSCKYVFFIASKDDYIEAEELIEKYSIDNYLLKPIFVGNNVEFFREYVFLQKEDIVSNPITIKDIFMHQIINSVYFGKIYIMSDGNICANQNHPILGNIATDTVLDIVYKELTTGSSWLCIRSKSPCNKCVYQWLCPSPSDYEIQLGQFNLCHIVNEI